MSFLELKSSFSSGAISKPDFIQAALQEHRRLFEYVDVVRTTDLREIAITGDGVFFLIGDEQIRLLCPPDEARVVPIEVMNFDRYEPEETRVMSILSEHAKVVLDVGANIGWYSAWFAKRNPLARIYAFEPMPKSYSLLQRNIALNALGDRVSAFNYGLSETSGTVQYYVTPTGGTNASLRNVAANDNAQSILGLAVTLDQWAASHQVVPDLIKCDVEGAELLVFKGGQSTLARFRPVVFAELLRKWARPFGYHPNDVIDFFGALGYRCVAIGASGTRPISVVNDDTVETNYVFLHPLEHHGLLERLGLDV